MQADSDKRVDDFPTDPIMQRLLSCQKFRSIYEKRRIQQKECFKEYLDSFGVDIIQEGLHLVDIGWKGSIQDHIYKILDGNIKVSGYYLGLIQPSMISPNNEKEGILFSEYPQKTPYFEVYNENRALFEIICGASHGSANRYVEQSNKIVVELLEQKAERELFQKHIHPFQKRIEAKFVKLCDFFNKIHFQNNEFENFIARKHARIVFFPTKKELTFFQRLYHYENFGVFEFTKFDIDSKLTIAKRLNNIRRLLKTPKQTLSSGFWPSLTLINMGLPFLCKIYGIFRYYNFF